LNRAAIAFKLPVDVFKARAEWAEANLCLLNREIAEDAHCKTLSGAGRLGFSLQDVMASWLRR
jgi:hypothetical protein